MKKYRLKKDLPTWKAGTTFWIWEDENLYGMSEDWQPVMVYHFSTLFRFNLLNNKEWFEEIKEKPKSVWDLKKWDKYYYIEINACIDSIKFIDDYIDEDLLEIWNIFLIKEEAEKELEKRRAIQRIKKYCWENWIDNSFKEWKNCFFRNRNWKILFLTFKNIYLSPIWYFYYEDAKKILENFEEDLKFLFDNF